ncbi:hypothetical protein PF004_g32025 [Phytophthora fragariae]|uniref:Uncharacterized protein n=1 Tax=Phytophthora fragariae TaxID=53985 RepID=A0A6G0M7S0_9STRA|nr:hypothetical protein PF004_g32025 [Phytophthora fragariae]
MNTFVSSEPPTLVNEGLTNVQQTPAAPVATGGQPRDQPAATRRPAVLLSRDDGDDDDSSGSSSDDNSDGKQR